MDFVETFLFVVKQTIAISVLASVYCTSVIVPSFPIHQVKLHQIQVNTFIKVSTSSSIPPSNVAVRRKINLFSISVCFDELNKSEQISFSRPWWQSEICGGKFQQNNYKFYWNDKKKAIFHKKMGSLKWNQNCEVSWIHSSSLIRDIKVSASSRGDGTARLTFLHLIPYLYKTST